MLRSGKVVVVDFLGFISRVLSKRERIASAAGKGIRLSGALLSPSAHLSAHLLPLAAGA